MGGAGSRDEHPGLDAIVMENQSPFPYRKCDLPGFREESAETVGPGPGLVKTEPLRDFHWWGWHLLLSFLRRQWRPHCLPFHSLKCALCQSWILAQKCAKQPPQEMLTFALASPHLRSQLLLACPTHPKVGCSARVGQEAPSGQGQVPSGQSGLCRPDSTWFCHSHLWCGSGWDGEFRNNTL